jgi:hypothetical protein
MPRFVAIRLSNISTLHVKEPNSPVVISLHLPEPLSDAQLRHLSITSPLNPVFVEASVGGWNNESKTFDSVVSTIEVYPQAKAPPPSRKLRAVKRKRGYAFHD